MLDVVQRVVDLLVGGTSAALVLALDAKCSLIGASQNEYIDGALLTDDRLANGNLGVDD